jgi:hypothetical protein
LYIAYINTPRNKARDASYHAIPNASGFFKVAIPRTQQFAFELPPKQRVSLFADLVSLLLCSGIFHLWYGEALY